MFSNEFIQEVKDKNDITDVISGYVSLKRSGRISKGLCPFHSEKTPSFTVYSDTASFYCFGCQAGGDVIGFIRKIENLDYAEAIKFLANRAGIPIVEDRRSDGLSQMRLRIREQNREAGRFFYRALYSPEGRQALDYFHSRGLTDETIRHFGLGWSPDGWDGLSQHLGRLGYRKAEILAASDEYWKAQFDLDVEQLRKTTDPKAPFVHMGITMDRGAEEEAIAQRHIVTVKRDDKHVDVRVIDDEIAIVLRQLELTALVGGNEAINPFVATETYHRQGDGSWKLVSFVYTHIIPDNYTFRFLSE